jgi:plastocyanin
MGMKVIALVFTLFALAFAGCGSSGDGASSSATRSVTIKDYEYAPANLTVPVGTTVAFTNQDSTPHTATSKDSGAFESGPIDTDKSATIKLEKAGTFAYYCVFHPFMKGTITVE